MMDTTFTDFLIECTDPALFDRTIQQLGPAVLYDGGNKGDYITEDGYYIMRVFGDPGFLKFAIEHQGYGKIIKQKDLKTIPMTISIPLTKEQAISAMHNGLKVTHKYFSPDEFIYMKDGALYDEKDLRMLPQFWQWRYTEDWNSGWRVYLPKQKKQ